MCARVSAVAVVLSVAALVAVQAARVPLKTYDEPLWYSRSLRPIWCADEPRDYYWAIDLPGGCRLVYGAALRATETDALPNHPTDYSGSGRDNADNQAPADAVFVMRGCNYAAFITSLACLWYAAWRSLGRPDLALACLTPLVVSPLFPLQMVAKVGPDPFMVLGLCAFLAVWLKGHLAGRATEPSYILALALLGGLAVFGKQNGALAPVAYAGYALLHGRGPNRLVAPLLVLGGAFGVFYVLNPGFYGHAPQEVVRAILLRRAAVVSEMASQGDMMTRRSIVHHAIESWPLVPLALWLIWSRRRERWFAPVAWWGMTLWLGTVFTVNYSSYKYLLPANLGIYFTFALCAVSLVSAPPSEPSAPPTSRLGPAG